MASSAAKAGICENIGEETWNYIAKKLKVIFPIYMIAAIFELFHATVLRNNFDYTTLPYYIFDFLFIRAAGWRKFGTGQVVGASWYLSAYFLSILLLYPFLRKNKDFFLHITAPAIAIVGGGWFIIRQRTLNYSLEMDNDLGICLGLLRGIVEMCAGCTCFALTNRLCKRNTENIGTMRRLLWTIVEIGSMTAVFYIMTHVQRGNSDFLALVLLAFGIVASFSGFSYSSKALEKVNVNWISGFALSLYLNHYAWYRTFANRLPEYPFIKTVNICFALSILSAIVCLLVVRFFNTLRKCRSTGQKEFTRRG